MISPYFENSRGIGVAETALAISEKRMNSASGELALHVLEIMEALTKSSKTGEEIELESAVPKNILLNWDVALGELQTK